MFKVKLPRAELLVTAFLVTTTVCFAIVASFLLQPRVILRFMEIGIPGGIREEIEVGSASCQTLCDPGLELGSCGKGVSFVVLPPEAS